MAIGVAANGTTSELKPEHRNVFGAFFTVAAYFYFFWVLGIQTIAFMINANQYDAMKDSGYSAFFLYSIDYNEPLSLLKTYKAYDSLPMRLLINLSCLSLFAILHSALARPFIKRLMPIVGTESKYGVYNRGFYVFQSSLTWHLLIAAWQPLYFWSAPEDKDEPLSHIEVWGTYPQMLIGYFLGYAWMMSSTFALDHFDLCGLKQAFNIDFMAKMGAPLPEDKLTERAHYALCRHPIMFGILILFFCVPKMTLNHLVFSVACSTYIFFAVTFLEEPDMESFFPEEYPDYKKRVPMFCPFTNGFPVSMPISVEAGKEKTK